MLRSILHRLSLGSSIDLDLAQNKVKGTGLGLVTTTPHRKLQQKNKHHLGKVK